MRTARLLLIALAVACLAGTALPAVAAASGCTNSAGDNQYIDPLQQCNSGGSTTSTTTTHPTTPPPTVVTTPTTVSPATTTVASTTTTTPTAAAGDPGGGKSLPYTGFGVGTALVVAFALLGGGFALRRITARSSL